MAELKRTNLSAPPVPLSTRQPSASSSKTTKVLGQLATLGAAGVQLYTKEHEAKMSRIAMNDLVNDAVNPDMQEHEAAYAQTVAKGQAMRGYSDLQQQIKNGTFNKMEPEEFQKVIRDGHNSYKEGIAKSKHSALEAAEYDAYWMQHEATITAGQAGMYRKYKGVQMQTALSGQLSAAIQTPGITVEKLKELGTDPKFSLLNEDNILDSIMMSGISFAQEQPKEGLRILLEMKDELHFDADPARSTAFRAAITKARKDINHNDTALTRKEEIDLVTMAQDLVNSGNFNDNHIAIFANEKKQNGNFVYTPKQLNAMKQKSLVNRANANLTEGYKKSFKSGVDILTAPKKDFDAVTRNTWAEVMLNANGDTVKAVEHMGRFLVNQTREWDELKGRSTMFQAQLMMDGTEVNRATMLQFDELQALERGMSGFNNGEKKFHDYIGESLLHYEAIKDAMVLAPGTKEEKWASVAQSLQLQKDTAKKQSVMSNLSTEAKNVGKQVAQEVMQTTDNPWIPDTLERWMAPEDTGDRLVQSIAQRYEQKINENWSPTMAEKHARAYAADNTFKWGGENYDMQGVKPEALFGTSDYEGVFQTMLQDPQWNAILKDAFGVTLGEMYFGRDETELTEEDRAEQDADRKGKRLFLSQSEIRKEINVENGTIDFRSEVGLGTVFSLPLRELSKAHESKRHGTEEIDRLERLYGDDFQATEEGKAWAVKESALNDEYLTNVLGTDAAVGRTTMTRDEYVGMPDIEKTRERKLFHKNNYEGFIGTFSQIVDYFGNKIKVDTILDDSIINPLNTL